MEKESLCNSDGFLLALQWYICQSNGSWRSGTVNTEAWKVLLQGEEFVDGTVLDHTLRVCLSISPDRALQSHLISSWFSADFKCLNFLLISGKSALQKAKILKLLLGNVHQVPKVFTLHCNPKVRLFCAHQGWDVSVHTLKHKFSKGATVWSIKYKIHPSLSCLCNKVGINN